MFYWSILLFFVAFVKDWKTSFSFLQDHSKKMLNFRPELYIHVGVLIINGNLHRTRMFTSMHTSISILLDHPDLNNA